MKLNKEPLHFSILNLDKPKGPTSFQISQFVKDALKISKTSHMGTLDPQVTGVLPITLGRACKLAPILMHRNKTYIGIMRLHKDIPKSRLLSIMKSFEGEITQLPPVRSAVKRAPRKRTVHSFDLIEKDGKDVLFKAEVQAGTYIRTLCHNLGERTGGAHMLELRRTKAGIFSEKDNNFINLYDFEKAVKEDNLQKYLIQAEDTIKSLLPTIQANLDSIQNLLTGKPLYKKDIIGPLPKEKTFAIFNNNDFIGIYTQKNEGDIIARPDFIYN
jgi:H/ACA ribonucleoprotein complex subunit 4